MKLTSDAQQNRILIETAFNQLFDRMTHLEGRMDTIDLLLSGEYVLMKAVDSPHKDRLDKIEHSIRSVGVETRGIIREIESLKPLVELIESVKHQIREDVFGE